VLLIRSGVMLDETVFCKNCKWVKKKFWDEWSHAICTHASSLKSEAKVIVEDFDFFVTGELKEEEKRKLTDYHYCTTQRKHECGRTGRYFEPKEEQARKLFKVERKLDKELD
jgi:hypothetical protein